MKYYKTEDGEIRSIDKQTIIKMCRRGGKDALTLHFLLQLYDTPEEANESS